MGSDQKAQQIRKREGAMFTNGDFPHKCKCLLQKGNFYASAELLLWLLFFFFNNPYVKEAYFGVGDSAFLHCLIFCLLCTLYVPYKESRTSTCAHIN